MEVYYKDLISEDATLEKLVDDLLQVVQGVDEFAQATGSAMEGAPTGEVASRLERLKEGCARLRRQAASGAHATDKVLRQNPYAFAGFAFAAGLLIGALACRSWYSNKRRD